MSIILILPIIMGIFIASQTAINSRLSQYTKLPLFSSTISFAIGAFFLLIICIVQKIPLNISFSIFQKAPWWAWLGGFTAAFALTSNILLFKHLGSIQATLYPVVGQIIMSLLIDQFGWFNSPVEKMNWLNIFGTILLIVGLVIFINLRASSKNNNFSFANLMWQVIGITAGIALAIQNAVNGKLGSVLASPLQASLFAFTISFLVLLLINLLLRVKPTKVIFNVIKTSPKSEWWIWLGGILGSSYVALSALLVPSLGTGRVVIIALFGQLVFSALIQQFGWFKSIIHRITRSQIIGTIIMFIGIILIKFC